MKFFYFPNSENLNDHWFHRLIFPLYKVCLLLFTIGFLGYFLVNSTIFLFNITKANFSGNNNLSWCSDYLDNLKNVYKDNNDSYQTYQTYYSSLNSIQESLLTHFPIEKAKGYASSLGGCLFKSNTDNTRGWASDKSGNKLYILKEYVSQPGSIFLGYLTTLGICLIVYLIIAIIPGLIYKYILFVIYGKKLDKLLSKNLVNEKN